MFVTDSLFYYQWLLLEWLLNDIRAMLLPSRKLDVLNCVVDIAARELDEVFVNEKNKIK